MIAIGTLALRLYGIPYFAVWPRFPADHRGARPAFFVGSCGLLSACAGRSAAQDLQLAAGGNCARISAIACFDLRSSDSGFRPCAAGLAYHPDAERRSFPF